MGTITSLTGTGVIDFIWEEIGKILNSSSMTTHALHDATDNKNLSLKRPVASEWDSVRYLSWTSWTKIVVKILKNNRPKLKIKIKIKNLYHKAN